MASSTDIFKALADDLRLRILRALDSAELSVAEIVEILGMPQSTVSRHLKPLRDTELVQTRREGTSVFYQPGKTFVDPAFKAMLISQLADLELAVEDKKSIDTILDQRRMKSRLFFDEVAGRYADLAQPGGGWSYLSAALAAGFSGKRVADIGSGEGDLALLLARYADEVLAVDQSQEMLKLVEEKAASCKLNGVTILKGDLENVPVEDESCDAAFLSQALHHAAHPARAVQEAARILKKGGQLIVVDLATHDQEWMREEWADVWLGFDAGQLRQWMTDANLEYVKVEALQPEASGVPILLAVGLKK